MTLAPAVSQRKQLYPNTCPSSWPPSVSPAPFLFHPQKRNLRAHIRAVHEQRTFACPFANCDKQFSYKKSLNDHMEKEHSALPQLKTLLGSSSWGSSEELAGLFRAVVGDSDGSESISQGLTPLPLISSGSETEEFPNKRQRIEQLPSACV